VCSSLFDKAIQIDSRQPLYFYYKGEVLHVMERYTEAIEHFDQAIQLDPESNADFYFTRANVFVDLFNCSDEKSDYLRKAIESFEKAIEMNPNDVDYQIDLGNAYHSNKNMRKAEKCFKRAIELNPNKAEAYNGLGQVFNDKKGVKKDYLLAIGHYNEAITLDPKNALFHRNKGITYFCLKEYEKAIKYYDDAIRLDPSDSQFLFYKAESHKKLLQFEKAQQCYKKASELKPTDLEAKKCLAIVTQKLAQLKKSDLSPVKQNGSTSARPVNLSNSEDDSMNDIENIRCLSSKKKRKLSSSAFE